MLALDQTCMLSMERCNESLLLGGRVSLTVVVESCADELASTEQGSTHLLPGSFAIGVNGDCSGRIESALPACREFVYHKHQYRSTSYLVRWVKEETLR